MLRVRYQSPDTPGRLIYASGEGTSESPSLCNFTLPGSGSYFLYVSYLAGEDETDVKLQFFTKPVNVDEWFPIRSATDNTIVEETLTAGTGDEAEKFRLVLAPETKLYIGPSEKELLVSIVASMDGETEASGLLTVILSNAVRPEDVPYNTPGFNDIRYGSLQINFADDGDAGAWKFAHEEDDAYRDGGVTETGLGLGGHLIFFKEVGGVIPNAQYIVVTEDTVEDVTYPPAE